MNKGEFEELIFLVSGYLEKEQAEELTSKIIVNSLEREKQSLKEDLVFLEKMSSNMVKEIENSENLSKEFYHRGLKTAFDARTKVVNQKINDLNELLINVLK